MRALRRRIAEAYAIDEVKDIRDRGIALETYARQAQNAEDERRCREIRMRAERRVGQLLKETERATGSPGNQYTGPVERDDGSTKPLGELGISRDQSSRWQRVASLTEDEFEAALQDCASTSDMVEAATLSAAKSVLAMWRSLISA
jgi:hypothetical protein